MKLFYAAAAVLFVPSAAAQQVDFGAWCSDIAHYDEDRCAEQRPGDKSDYDRYAASVRVFEDEKHRKQEARRIETDRVNRMGDVTADQVHDSALGN